jgi:hypothetical protein
MLMDSIVGDRSWLATSECSITMSSLRALRAVNVRHEECHDANVPRRSAGPSLERAGLFSDSSDMINWLALAGAVIIRPHIAGSFRHCESQ